MVGSERMKIIKYHGRKAMEITLPRVIVGFGPSVTYSCCCDGMDVYHTLNIRTC